MAVRVERGCSVKILTVHEPWAWAFFLAGKDVENRSRPTKHRGPLAIQVSKKRLKPDELTEIANFIVGARGLFASVLIGTVDQRLRGHIIGIVDVVDCVRDSASRWAMPGYYHWTVAKQRRVKPVPIVGQLGMFERDVDLEYL